MLHIITYPSPISTYPVYSQGFHNNISKTNYDQKGVRRPWGFYLLSFYIN